MLCLIEQFNIKLRSKTNFKWEQN